MAFEKFVKPIREEGIIISKRYQEAKPARTDFNGKEWPATEEKFLVEVISCDAEDFDKETGIKDGTRLEYPVDKTTFQKAKFGMWAKVKFIASQFGSVDSKRLNMKPETCVLIENTK